MQLSIGNADKHNYVLVHRRLNIHLNTARVHRIDVFLSKIRIRIKYKKTEIEFISEIRVGSTILHLDFTELEH